MARPGCERALSRIWYLCAVSARPQSREPVRSTFARSEGPLPPPDGLTRPFVKLCVPSPAALYRPQKTSRALRPQRPLRREGSTCRHRGFARLSGALRVREPGGREISRPCGAKIDCCVVWRAHGAERHLASASTSMRALIWTDGQRSARARPSSTRAGRRYATERTEVPAG